MDGLLSWIVVGLVAGFLAQVIAGNVRGGLLMTLALGVIGAVVGGYVMGLFGYGGVSGINVWSIVVATIGAILLVLLFRALRR